MVAYAKGTCKGERMADDEYSKIKIGSNSCSVTISLTRENWLATVVTMNVRNFHFVLIIESIYHQSLLLTPSTAVKAIQLNGFDSPLPLHNKNPSSFINVYL